MRKFPDRREIEMRWGFRKGSEVQEVWDGRNFGIDVYRVNKDSEWTKTTPKKRDNRYIFLDFAHFFYSEIRFRNNILVSLYGIWKVSQNHLRNASSSCSRKSYFITKCTTTILITMTRAIYWSIVIIIKSCQLVFSQVEKTLISSPPLKEVAMFWLTTLSNHLPRLGSLARHPWVRSPSYYCHHDETEGVSKWGQVSCCSWWIDVRQTGELLDTFLHYAWCPRLTRKRFLRQQYADRLWRM